MPPVPRSRSGAGESTPMNDTNTSFSFQIPGSMLQSTDNLLADDSSDFFLGGASADIDMSAGSPLKFDKNHNTQTTATTMRRMTRSQSRSPQKQQPPRSAKKRGALGAGMAASSSGLSFPASMYPSLQEEQLMEVEEMDGMDGMDTIDDMDADMDVDDREAPPVLEPIAGELNKPRSSARRSRSPAKSKSKSKAKGKSEPNTTAPEHELESPALASMSAYLPPPSPAASTPINGDKLYPNAFDFGFSPQTTATSRMGEASAQEKVLGNGQEESVGEQGVEVEATTSAAGTGNAERKIPASRLERREKRVTSRSKKTGDLPTDAATISTIANAGPIDPDSHGTSAPPSKTQETTKPIPASAEEPLPPAKTQAQTDTQIHAKASAPANPFDALKKRVASAGAGAASSLKANVDAPTQSSAGTSADDKSSNSSEKGSGGVSEQLTRYGQKIFGKGFPSFVKPRRNSNATTTTMTITPEGVAAAPAAPASAPSSAGEGSVDKGAIMNKEERVSTTASETPAPATTITTTTAAVAESSQAVAITTTAKPASRWSLTSESKAPPRVFSAPSAAPASVTEKTTSGTKRSAFEALKAGLGDSDKAVAKATASGGNGGTGHARIHNSVGASTKKRSSSDAAEAVSGGGGGAVPGAAREMVTAAKTVAGGGDVDNGHSHSCAGFNTKKRPSSDAEDVPRTGGGSARETETVGAAGSDNDGASAAIGAQAPPPRKRARRESVLLGRAVPTSTAAGSSSSVLKRRGSLLSQGSTAKTTTGPSTAATVDVLVPPIEEEAELEPEPESEHTMDLVDAVAPAVEAMDVEAEAPQEPVVRNVDMSPPTASASSRTGEQTLAVDAPVGRAMSMSPSAVSVPPSTADRALEVEAKTTTPSVDPPAPGPSSGATTTATTVLPAEAACRKVLRKRKQEEEAGAQRRRDEAKREARREQQKVLRKSLAVVAAAAAATVVAAVAADVEYGGEGENEHESEADEDEDEGGNGGEKDAEDEDEEERLPALNFGATKAADSRKPKVEPKGKGKAETGQGAKRDSKKRIRTTSTTNGSTKATTSRSTTASSSKAAATRPALVQAHAKASRKIATNARVNASKKGLSASSAVAGPSSLPSAELQIRAAARTRSHSRADTDVASTKGAPAGGSATASGASLATSSASSLASRSRQPFQVLPPATLHDEFAARAEARREARKREKERDPSETHGVAEDPSSANTAMRSTSRTSNGNGNSGTVKERPPIPDFAAMHAAQAALLARAKASLPPLTKPHGPALTTEARMKERAVFDAQVKEKEAEEERTREEERWRREQEEELEIRELRRRAVPKAHEVPEWYRDMPKKTKTTADSGDHPSSSTS